MAQPATINCPSCGSVVSAKAYDCPKCGHPLRKPRRGVMGTLIKWIFIAWNVLMLAWVITGLGAGGEVINQAASEAEEAGAAIGTAIGLSIIISTWAFGVVVLGLLVLLTRPRK